MKNGAGHVNITAGQVMRMMRLMAGLNLAESARQAQIGLSLLCHIERDTRTLHDDQKQALLAVYQPAIRQRDQLIRSALFHAEAGFFEEVPA